jgi:hypothetical protein
MKRFLVVLAGVVAVEAALALFAVASFGARVDDARVSVGQLRATSSDLASGKVKPMSCGKADVARERAIPSLRGSHSKYGTTIAVRSRPCRDYRDTVSLALP